MGNELVESVSVDAARVEWRDGPRCVRVFPVAGRCVVAGLVGGRVAYRVALSRVPGGGADAEELNLAVAAAVAACRAES